MSQISWEGRMAALTLEASRCLRELAGSSGAGDRVKSQISRAARACGLSYWRAFDLWYGKARCVRGDEMDAIRAATGKQMEAARAEARELLAVLSRYVEAHTETCAPADREVVAQARDLVRRLGARNSPRA